MLPIRVSNLDRPGGPANCVGQNVSPQLSWSTPPELTVAELNAKLEGHVRRAAAIVGLFTHP